MILSADSEISWWSSEFSFIHVWTSCWKIKSIYIILTYLNTVCMNFVMLIPAFTFFIENERCCNLLTASEILDLNYLTSTEIHSFFKNNACMIFFWCLKVQLYVSLMLFCIDRHVDYSWSLSHLCQQLHLKHDL